MQIAACDIQSSLNHRRFSEIVCIFLGFSLKLVSAFDIKGLTKNYEEDVVVIPDTR